MCISPKRDNININNYFKNNEKPIPSKLIQIDNYNKILNTKKLSSRNNEKSSQKYNIHKQIASNINHKRNNSTYTNILINNFRNNAQNFSNNITPKANKYKVQNQEIGANLYMNNYKNNSNVYQKYIMSNRNSNQELSTNFSNYITNNNIDSNNITKIEINNINYNNGKNIIIKNLLGNENKRDNKKNKMNQLFYFQINDTPTNKNNNEMLKSSMNAFAQNQKRKDILCNSSLNLYQNLNSKFFPNNKKNEKSNEKKIYKNNYIPIQNKELYLKKKISYTQNRSSSENPTAFYHKDKNPSNYNKSYTSLNNLLIQENSNISKNLKKNYLDENLINNNLTQSKSVRNATEIKKKLQKRKIINYNLNDYEQNMQKTSKTHVNEESITNFENERALLSENNAKTYYSHYFFDSNERNNNEQTPEEDHFKIVEFLQKMNSGNIYIK